MKSIGEIIKEALIFQIIIWKVRAFFLKSVVAVCGGECVVGVRRWVLGDTLTRTTWECGIWRKVYATLGVSCYLFLIKPAKMQGELRHEVALFVFTGFLSLSTLWHIGFWHT